MSLHAIHSLYASGVNRPRLATPFPATFAGFIVGCEIGCKSC
jgi:hypothetical protein